MKHRHSQGWWHPGFVTLLDRGGRDSTASKKLGKNFGAAAAAAAELCTHPIFAPRRGAAASGRNRDRELEISI